MCGGELGADWWADHVLAHAAGGRNALDNLLPACKPCNRYRWHYPPERIQLILEVGVHMCTEMDKRSELGSAVAGRIASRRRASARRRAHAPDAAGGPSEASS